MTSPKAYRSWRDQALRLLRLKGHFRARASGSTLWRNRWQEASEILCTKTTLFGESWATKNIVKKTRKCSLRPLLMSRFQHFAADVAKNKPHSSRYFETALRAVLINQFIRINSGPKILRSYLLPWSPHSHYRGAAHAKVLFVCSTYKASLCTRS